MRSASFRVILLPVFHHIAALWVCPHCEIFSFSLKPVSSSGYCDIFDLRSFHLLRSQRPFDPALSYFRKGRGRILFLLRIITLILPGCWRMVVFLHCFTCFSALFLPIQLDFTKHDAPLGTAFRFSSVFYRFCKITFLLPPTATCNITIYSGAWRFWLINIR